MRILIFAAIFFGGVFTYAKKINLIYSGQIHNYLNGWFGSADPRHVANDTQPGELAVHQLLLDDDKWCSAVMIGPQWAVTAAHCVTGNPVAIQFYHDNEPGPEIEVDYSWHGRYYGKLWTSGSIPFLYQDFGVVHLQSPAPKWVTFVKIAQPNEVYVGQHARTVGFPLKRFGGDTKVRAGHCSVRRLVADSILSDCAISEGSSGGAFYVYTRAGKWVLGGVASTEYGDNRNGYEHDIQGGPYSDALANHFVNIAYYSGWIAKVIMNYDGEKLPTLRASLTDSVICLTRFTSIKWNSIDNDAISACKNVQTQPQLACLTNLFQNPQAVNLQNDQHCLNVGAVAQVR